MPQSSDVRFGRSGKALALAMFCLVAAMALSAGCASKDTVRFQESVRKMTDAELRTYYRGINERTRDIEHSMGSREELGQYDGKHWVYSTPFSPGGEGYRLMEQRRMVEAEMSRRNLSP